LRIEGDYSKLYRLEVRRTLVFFLNGMVEETAGKAVCSCDGNMVLWLISFELIPGGSLLCPCAGEKCPKTRQVSHCQGVVSFIVGRILFSFFLYEIEISINLLYTASNRLDILDLLN
jgi:hypothetical protein